MEIERVGKSRNDINMTNMPSPRGEPPYVYTYMHTPSLEWLMMVAMAHSMRVSVSYYFNKHFLT